MNIVCGILALILFFFGALFIPALFSYNQAEQQEVIAMFESFDNAEEIVVLTCFQLVVNGTYYDLSEIQYNGQECHIVYLEEDGFYSYTFNEETLEAEFLFTLYDGFEVTVLGTDVLTSEVINEFFADGRFWFRMDDPRTEEWNQVYYTWRVDTKQTEIIDDVPENYEYSVDNNRTENYTLVKKTYAFLPDHIDVTDNTTGVTKRIDRKVLTQFEEGKKIKEINRMTMFNVGQVFEKDGDIYFISYFEIGFLGDPCYYYVVKWDFETEECEYYTALYFDEYQEWITDMYIK